MRKKFNVFLTLLLALVVQITFAQEKSISGVVTDAADGSPMVGANIIIKGTTKGAATDFDGKYNIKAKVGDILIFSNIGYTKVFKTVGSSNTINVTMSEGEKIGTVVVTALGIKRDKKSLGYSTQTVKTGDVKNANERNFMSAISGRVSGVDIKKSNSMGGSVNVIIRGHSSLTGNNQPLYIVDGVPFNNSVLNSGSQQRGSGGYDYGSPISDINASDIESVTVLKGGAASALYGSRAQNGVIMITTKSGKKNQGLGITIDQSISISQYDPDTYPEYQQQYGAGYGPYYSGSIHPGLYAGDVDGDGNVDYIAPTEEDASFGEKFDKDLMVYQWDSFYPDLNSYMQPRPWLAASNGPGYIFQTGMGSNTNVSMQSGNDKGSFRIGYTRDDVSGILPGSNILKNIIDLHSSYNFSEKLTVTAKANFSNTSGKGRYGTGYDSKNVMQSFRQWFETNVDLEKQKDAYFNTKKNISWNARGMNDLRPHYFDNPYWVIHENYETDDRTRFFGNASLNYKFNDWLSIIGRAGIDTYNSLQEERVNVSSLDPSKYSKYERQFTESNYDAMLKFNKTFNKKINVTGIAGTSVLSRTTISTYNSTNGGLNIPGLYSLSNSKNKLNPSSEYEGHFKAYGFYTQASFGYDDMLFVDASYRVDIASSLPEANNTYTYPAISTSFLFSKVLDQKWLNFGKIRLAYAKTGNYTSPYNVFDTYSAGTPFNGIPVYYQGSTANNSNLKNESSYEKELGVETKMFNNRFGFDVSFYQRNTVDQLMPVQVSTASGFYRKWVNAGEIENTGVELSMYGTPIKKGDFKVKVRVNWAKNTSLVKELYDGVDNILLYSAWSSSVNASVGQPYGVIKGTDFIYDDNGNRIVGPDGKYFVTSSTTEVLGKMSPDWKAGIQNTISYKNLNLTFLIDASIGGEVVSYDWAFGNATGLYANTAGNNELGNPKRDPVADGGGVLLDGVDSNGDTNTTRANASNYLTPTGYYGGSFYNPDGTRRTPYNADANNVFDASFVKLRELGISYRLPKKLLANTPIKGLSVGVTGRNLWIIYKNLPYGDPEAGQSAGNYQGIQNAMYPATKDYSFNVKINF